MVQFIESELVLLKKEIDEMWTLVYNQLGRAGEAVLTLDRELAQQVLVRERRVNAFELKIDSDIEDIIALYNPVAIDLRFVLAMLKINTNLERLGDFAEGIARFALNCKEPILASGLVKELRLEEISKSSVGRYATRSNKAMQRLLEAQAQTDRLIQAVKSNPDADYTEAAMMLTMNGLLNKVATAEEEWDEMPLDKAGRLIASLSRTKVYKDRVKQDMRKKADIAFQELEADMMKVIKQDEESVRMLKTILTKAKDRMMQDD